MENTLTQRQSLNSSPLVGSQGQRGFSRGSMPTRCLPHCSRLLLSDRKSKPGQPWVTKYSRHCSCWQQRRIKEGSHAVQTCAQGQPGEQLNQKPESERGACSQLCAPPQSLHHSQRCSQELNPKPPAAGDFLAQDIGSFILSSTFFSHKHRFPQESPQ